MKADYLIYHNKRDITAIGNLTVYHDSFEGNEDPYIWNDQFLHSYCHITQIPKNKGQINFWVSGDQYPNFTELYCDCVFVIKDIHKWDQPNEINSMDKIVDSPESYNHHYRWHGRHFFMKRDRFTIKGDRERSFQPQTIQNTLIDIIPFLNSKGVSTSLLTQSMSLTRNGKRAINSRPFKLDHPLGDELYDYLFKIASTKIFGKQLVGKHP